MGWRLLAPAPTGGLASLRAHLPLAGRTTALELAVAAHLPVPHACLAVALARVDRQRRDLVANVSHELRTPVSALRALLENLVDGVVQPDAERLQVALQQTERLGRLVADLLDFQRIEAGALVITREAIDLRELIEGVIEVARPAADGKATQLRLELPAQRLTCRGDRTRPRRIAPHGTSNTSNR